MAKFNIPKPQKHEPIRSTIVIDEQSELYEYLFDENGNPLNRRDAESNLETAPKHVIDLALSKRIITKQFFEKLENKNNERLTNEIDQEVRKSDLQREIHEPDLQNDKI